MSKKVMALIFISLLLISSLCPAARVFATDISDTASSWKEFDAWMTAHKKSGGTLKLTADIRCEQEIWSYIRPRNAEPVTLELEGHSLIFTGTAELRAYNFNVRGNGGESASLKAAAGSYVLYKTYGESRLTGKNGPVLWQEEGAVLYADSTWDGAVHFAREPVAESIDEVKIVPVEPEEDGISRLPHTVQARICHQGNGENKTLPVHWNLDQKARQAFQERCRLTVCGSLDIPSLKTPKCTVVFKDQSLTWTNIKVRASSGLRYDILADFEASTACLFDVQAQYSFDGENYAAAAQTRAETEKEQSFAITFYEPDYFQYIEQKPEDLIWNTDIHPYLYLRIEWLSASAGERKYSDVVKISGVDFSIVPVTDGNRGGGTGIINSPGESDPKEKDDGSVEENSGEAEESSQKEVYGPKESRVPADEPAAAGNDIVPQKPIPVTEWQLPLFRQNNRELEQQTRSSEQENREFEKKTVNRAGEKNEAAQGGQRFLSVMVGLGAVAAVMAAATLFFHPGLLLKILSRFRKSGG